MSPVTIQETLKEYSSKLTGTELDIPLYRQLCISLNHTLPSARNGTEFIVGRLCITILQDLFRNTIENHCVKNNGLNDYLKKIRVSVTSCSTLDWEIINNSLSSLGDNFRKFPEVIATGNYVEVNGYNIYSPSKGCNIWGVEGQHLPIFFDLDINLLNPKTAPKIVNWYVTETRVLLGKITAKGEKIHGLCFVEKGFSDVGAIMLMPYLVSELKLPAIIYRADYWNPSVNIIGQPQSGYNYLIVYDVIGRGGAVLEAHNYLSEHYGAAIKACVVFFECETGGREALDKAGIQLVSRDKFSQVLSQFKSTTSAVSKKYSTSSCPLPGETFNTIDKEKDTISEFKTELDYPAKSQLQPLDTLPRWNPTFLNAFFAEDLTRRKVRNYFVIVSTSQNRVERIIQSPYEGECDENSLDKALERELTELSKKYPLPSYDIIIGRGDLDMVKNSFITIHGWADARIEDLKT